MLTRARRAAGRVSGPVCAGRRAERGSVTVFTVVFAIAVMFLLALIIDGGIAMNAKQRAADIAGQAARAAADTINVAVLRQTGAAQMAPGACGAAAGLVRTYGQKLSTGVDRVTSTTMVSCVAPSGARVATVQVTVATSPLVPGVFGAFHETASASATTECGITEGGAC
jgi:Flp pilus assembly protein TadG